MRELDENDQPYPRNCQYCGERIIMAPGNNGGWVPLDIDYGGFHDCTTGSIKYLPPPPRKRLTIPMPPAFRPPAMWERLVGKVIASEPANHPRKGPLWLVDLLYVVNTPKERRSYRTRIQVDTDFPLGASIGGRVVTLVDVGTFLENAKEC
jgi:hypothetical protein